jgi:succinyl-CoA synthetase beta subunit
MKIHEYQAKELLAAVGANVPRGVIASSPEEAVRAFDTLGGPVVLKAQIHAGGRGKGEFKGSGLASGEKGGLGGVKYLRKREDVTKIAEIMFKYPLATHQTGPEGQKVSKLLVVEASTDIMTDPTDPERKRKREVYVGVVLDRAIGLPILMGCAEGGVEIEEVAAKHPEKILKTVIDPDAGLHPYQARRMAFELGFKGDEVPQAEKILTALVRVFLDKDCSLAEINPLVVMENGQVQVLDAKINFDDNALFRHPEIAALRDLTEENPAEVRAGKANLSYISLDGNIGCLVNGAGLAMSTMDIIKYHGGEPANFLDVGGGVTADGAIEAFRIILSDPKVKGVLVNIFGGIAKCDLIAEALVKAGREVGFKVPVVVRLEGTNVTKAREILAGVKGELPMMQTASDLTEAAKRIVAAAK